MSGVETCGAGLVMVTRAQPEKKAGHPSVSGLCKPVRAICLELTTAQFAGGESDESRREQDEDSDALMDEDDD